jgi:hypothetical protein
MAPPQIVAQLSGLLRHEIMDFMFSDPTMLDDLDFLYKSDTARKLMFYYQVTTKNYKGVVIVRIDYSFRTGSLYYFKTT